MGERKQAKLELFKVTNLQKSPLDIYSDLDYYLIRRLSNIDIRLLKPFA